LAAAGGFVSLAAVNGPDNFVLSGRNAELQKIEDRLRASGALVTRLAVSHAFHSAQMDDVAATFARFVATVPMQEPQVIVVSSVTGHVVTLDELRQAEYWRRQVRDAVQFQAGMETLSASGLQHFVEIGPAPVLIGMGRQCLGERALWAPSVRKDRSEGEQARDSLAQLYVHGADVRWDAVGPATSRRVIDLPTYPFERQRYWIDATPSAVAPVAPAHAWDVVCEAARWQAGQGRLDLSVDRYARGWPLFEQLTNAYILSALEQLGAFKQRGVVLSLDALVAEMGVQPGFTRLLGRWLQRAVNVGAIRATSDGYVADVPLRVPDIAALLREARDVFGEDHSFLDYVESCGSQLPAYLTGATSTLETLFPNGSFERAEGLYEHAPLSAYFAGIGRAAIDALVRARRGMPVRAIEIGAGTGATTSALLPVLPADGAEYHFTDLSDFFLSHAREKFARYPFVRYGHFDAERPGTEQGYADGTFDVVVATNVLHATRDLRETLRHVRALLAPGGMLLLCEVTTYLPWFDITTGLIEGWQLFEDGLRDDHPLLAADQWTPLIADAGFEQVAAFPDAASPAAVLGQHVILAQVPGQAMARGWMDATSGATPMTGADSETSAADVPRAAAASARSVRDELVTMPASERRERLVTLVRAELARSLRVSDPESLERKRRLIEFGIDSLMAVELRNRLATALALPTPLPATLIFDHPSIDALAEYLEYDVLGLRDDLRDDVPSPAPEAAEPSLAASSRAREIEELSEEEAEALLLRRLQSR
jgi:SAM-dependent methyltransferase